MPVKDNRNGIAWVNPVDTRALNNAVAAAQDARDRAGQSATLAGNAQIAAETAANDADYAASQAEVLNQKTKKYVEDKFW